MKTNTGIDAIRQFLMGQVAELLKTQADQIDPDAPLFDLGIDSLIVIYMLEIISAQYETKLSIQECYENSTINGLANVLYRKVSKPQ
jgi:aryl carrier-like protein